ncbi:MAG: hypothetical protein GY854_32125 [Deltaproteobacteria bacterium]|nr:hypothetical protein [Deltaproteobacteria bacterium]
MTDDTGILERVGEEVAGALGTGPPESRRAAQKRDLLSMLETEKRPSRGRYFVMAAAAAVIIASAIGLIAFRERQNPLPFWIGEKLVAGDEGSWIDTSQNTSTPIRFAGGSRMEFSQESTARVVASNDQTVQVSLSDGEVFADINGNGKTNWRLKAGPYQVDVVGTIFEVSWNKSNKALNVAVKKGVVLVSGEGLNKPGVRLTTGERLQVDKNKVLVSLDSEKSAVDTGSSVSNVSSPPSIDPEPEIGVDEDTRSDIATAKKSAARTASVQRAETRAPKATHAWRGFYDNKDYRGALDAAEEAGLAELLATLGCEDLWRIASAARYARKGQASIEALLSIRERCPKSKRAKTATFLLGRVSQELKGDVVTAQRWFGIYLNETPGGPLAEEALGRLIDACARAGKRREARQHAEEYLSRYPDGPFVELAQSALKK